MESVWSHMAEFHRRNQNSMDRPFNVNSIIIESLEFPTFSFTERFINRRFLFFENDVFLHLEENKKILQSLNYVHTYIVQCDINYYTCVIATF